MRTLLTVSALALVLTFGLKIETAQAEHHEGGPKVLQVFTIDVAPKDRAAVLTRLKDLQTILTKEGQPKFGVWLGSYAGDSVGKLFLTVERNDYADFGVNAGKIVGSAAVKKWIDDMNKSGISKVVSQSLLVAVTP